MKTGIVDFFDNLNGWGFIKSNDDGQAVFVHYTEILSNERRRSLNSGDSVTFEIIKKKLEDGSIGTQAQGVEVRDSVLKGRSRNAVLSKRYNNTIRRRCYNTKGIAV